MKNKNLASKVIAGEVSIVFKYQLTEIHTIGGKRLVGLFGVVALQRQKKSGFAHSRITNHKKFDGP
jgi:hypothetical protein